MNKIDDQSACGIKISDNGEVSHYTLSSGLEVGNNEYDSDEDPEFIPTKAKEESSISSSEQEDSIPKNHCPSMSRRTSTIYTFFHEKSDKVAICKFCNREINYQSTSNNLRKHLIRKHPDINLHKSCKIATIEIAKDLDGTDSKWFQVELNSPTPAAEEEMMPENEIIYCLDETTGEVLEEPSDRTSNKDKCVSNSETPVKEISASSSIARKLIKNREHLGKSTGKINAKKMTLLNLEEAIKNKELEKNKLEVQHLIAKNYLEIQILETERKIKEAQLKKLL